MTQKEKLKGMLAQDKIKQVLDELLAHFKDKNQEALDNTVICSAMTQKEKLKSMLAQDKIKQVLDELLAHFKDENQEALDNTVICSANYNSLNNSCLQRLITQEFYTIEKAGITKAVLAIINRFVD